MEQRVREVISQVLGVDAKSINSTTSVQSVSAWDSLAHMNLVLALEEAFGVEFTDEQIPTMTSFPEVLKAVEARGGRA